MEIISKENEALKKLVIEKMNYFATMQTHSELRYDILKQQIAGAIYLIQNGENNAYIYSFYNKLNNLVYRVQFEFEDFLYRIDFVKNTIFFTIGEMEIEKFYKNDFTEVKKIEFSKKLIKAKHCLNNKETLFDFSNFYAPIDKEEFYHTEYDKLQFITIFRLMFYMGLEVPYYRNIMDEKLVGNKFFYRCDDTIFCLYSIGTTELNCYASVDVEDCEFIYLLEEEPNNRDIYNYIPSYTQDLSRGIKINKINIKELNIYNII